jgi:hypothetical protein
MSDPQLHRGMVLGLFSIDLPLGICLDMQVSRNAGQVLCAILLSLTLHNLPSRDSDAGESVGERLSMI